MAPKKRVKRKSKRKTRKARKSTKTKSKAKKKSSKKKRSTKKKKGKPKRKRSWRRRRRGAKSSARVHIVLYQSLNPSKFVYVPQVQNIVFCTFPIQQTPALPHEAAVVGSNLNKAGTAASKGKAHGTINFDASTLKVLKTKLKEHNKKYGKIKKRKVTLGQLKKVHRRGSGAFSSSHRPGKTRVQWALARVNMFLKMKAGGAVKQAYRDADGDI
jgi:hypothetical protein